MKVGEAIAEILKREGVEIIFGYPVNHVLEAAACAGIRPVIVRQERVGLHMADAMARVSSGREARRLCDAARPGCGKLFRWRRASLQRVGSDARDAHGLCAAAGAD